MPATPHSNIDHFELNGNPEVPINDAFDDLDNRMNAWHVIAMADANQNLLTTVDGDGDPVALRNRAFEATGALTTDRDVTLPDEQGVYYFWNNTTGGFSIIVKTVTDTTGVAVPAGDKVIILVESTTFDVRVWYEKMGIPSFVIGAEGGSPNAINVAIQLKDSSGADLAVRGSVFAYLSDDANGDSIAASAPSGGVAIGTDGLAIPVVADKAFQLVSEADGDIDLDITEGGIDTWHLILIMPDGRLVASDAITFA